MKALSIRQPWAADIANGEKWIEYRSWTTPHRSPLLICASKNPRPRGFKCGSCGWLGIEERCKRGRCPRCGCGAEDTGQSLPVGVAVAMVHLAGCDGDEGEWYLDHVQPIEPFPVSGRLGLHEVTCPAKLKKIGAPLECPRDGWEGGDPVLST